MDIISSRGAQDLLWTKSRPQAGSLQLLVATDVAARGLHVKHLPGALVEEAFEAQQTT